MTFHIATSFARAACFLLISTSAWASLIVQASAPGVQTTVVPGATTYDFNNLTLGTHTNVSVNFGSVTGVYDTLTIQSADQYGGANGSLYPLAQTLTLSGSVNYFGMWWSAGDSGNRLDFYLGANLVASYSTATAFGILPGTYYGNPNGGGDSGEPFAYLNFFGTSGTTFDSIHLVETSTCCQFESDNHSVAVGATPGNGLALNPTPEPASVWLLAVGVASLEALRRRRFRRAV